MRPRLSQAQPRASAQISRPRGFLLAEVLRESAADARARGRARERDARPAAPRRGRARARGSPCPSSYWPSCARAGQHSTAVSRCRPCEATTRIIPHTMFVRWIPVSARQSISFMRTFALRSGSRNRSPTPSVLRRLPFARILCRRAPRKTPLHPAAVRRDMALHQATRARRVRKKLALAVRCDMVLRRVSRARHLQTCNTSPPQGAPVGVACVCVYIYIYIYIHTHTRMYIYIYIYIYI